MCLTSFRYSTDLLSAPFSRKLPTPAFPSLHRPGVVFDVYTIFKSWHNLRLECELDLDDFLTAKTATSIVHGKQLGAQNPASIHHHNYSLLLDSPHQPLSASLLLTIRMYNKTSNTVVRSHNSTKQILYLILSKTHTVSVILCIRKGSIRQLPGLHCLS